MARRRRRRMTRKQARMRRRRIRIAGFCLAGCILILGIVCGAFHHYVSQFPEDKIAENIYVGTVDLSGLSKKEALEKLAGQKKADQKQTVSLTVEGQKAEATLEECGFDYVRFHGLFDDNMCVVVDKVVWGEPAFRYYNFGNIDKIVDFFLCEYIIPYHTIF